VSPASVAAPVLPTANVTPALKALDFAAKDGTHVRGTVYLPHDPQPGERFGVVAQISPYFHESYGIGTGDLYGFAGDFFGVGMLLGHGFAYVAANVPGTGDSSGCFEIGGADEQRELAEFVDWIGEQPWSNGNVGVMGVSYDGTTPWEVAIGAPKHLKTIVPIEGISDFYRYEYQDGAPYYLQGPTFYPRYWVDESFGYDPLLEQQAPVVDPTHVCALEATHLAESLTTTEKGVYDSFWQERNLSAKFSKINASVFLVHGLADWNVKPDNGAVLDLIPGEKMQWWGQWEHNIPWSNTHNKDWSRPDWNSTIVAWFDHYLDGKANGIPGSLPAVQVQDTDGRWRNETDWPPRGTTNLTLHLAPGKLQDAPGSGSVTVYAMPTNGLGLPVEGALAASPAQPSATFVSEPLAQDVRVAGMPRLVLGLSADRPGDGHVVVQLYNVTDKGAWWWVDEGGRGLEQRNGRAQSDAVAPGEAMTVPVDLYPSEAVFHKGERIALVVLGEDASWYNANGNEPALTLDLAKSALTLPLLPAGAPAGVDTKAIAASNPYYTPGTLDR